EYTIGSSEVVIGGQKFTSDPIKVKIVPDNLDALPPSLQKEPIRNPHCSDPNINQQLRGKMFLRPVLSKTDPYIGEPVLLSLYLYFDPMLQGAVANFSTILPDSSKMLADEVNLGTGQRPSQAETIDGREFRVVLCYQAALTPSEPGETSLVGYGARVQVLTRRRASRSLMDDFFDDSFFGNAGIAVDAMSGELKLYVRPLPDSGKDPKFSGTVGSFTLDSKVDRQSASQDDIITLTVSIQGSGNIAQAAVPVFPEQHDFELFDQTQKTDKVVNAQGLSGIKKVEYLLRPVKSGKLNIPQIDYIIFDPKIENYKTLRTEPRDIAITPGKSSGAIASVTTAPNGPPRDTGPALRYIAPSIDCSLTRPLPLLESPVFWASQLGMIGLAGWSAVRARKRGRIDPAQVRRNKARPTLIRKLDQIRNEVGSGDITGGAAALDRALRAYIADLRNISPEGLTLEEIPALLREEAFDEEQATRLIRIISLCANVNYAPVGAEQAGLAGLLDEAASLFGEDQKS
ncbi:BatD family protein, partial [Candidatus Sumerlaeota bacterium]|nr:BatD family protein [Candidatus Sumerlaeota bacterium]